MLLSIRARLSIMMFLQYFVIGAHMPILSHYLKNFLLFNPFQVGVVLAMGPLAAIVAPFFVTLLADRCISAERLLAVSHFIAGAVILILRFQTDFWVFLGLYFVYGLAFIPTFALTNSVALHHVADAKRDFAPIRLWGPVSWVVVAFGFSYLWLGPVAAGERNARLPDAFVVCAITSIVLGFYCLTLPRSLDKSARKEQPGFFKGDTLRNFARPSLVVLCIVTFLNALIHQCYYYGMGPFMSQIGFADRHIMPAMSLGQVGEIIAMALLAAALYRLSLKTVLVIGVLAQVFRCLVFATGIPGLVMIAIPSHGLCYAFFFTAAYIYVDTHSTRGTRVGAQQLFNILIAGVGNLAGNLVAGQLGSWFSGPTGQINFTAFWLVSAMGALAVSIILMVLFKEEPARNPAKGS
ncbi:MAG: MFS transporter [Candidatus Hydrogenedentes bacterium]|nr:MFS transporter [Candidatus Hydrogenedentota bacterium]